MESSVFQVIGIGWLLIELIGLEWVRLDAKWKS